MTIGSQVLAVFQGNVSEQSINHLALKVDDFEGVYTRLADLGYRVFDGDMVEGPEGIYIQLVR